MRVLVLTKIFPNSVEPYSSPFNRQQFGALARSCELTVLATIPWFPGARRFRRWSRAGRLVAVPGHELIDALEVSHPRFVYIPKVGNAVSGALYAASLAPWVLRYRGKVDVVLGSWAYPDGYAAVVLADLIGAASVVKVHGSDINVLGREPASARRLRWALPRATRIVAVSRALAGRVAELGVPADRVDVVPNGVDSSLFRPRNRAQARRRLGLTANARAVLYVGRVEREKGALDLLSAMTAPKLADAELWVVGDGSALGECRELARRLEVRALFTGALPHDQVPDWLAASNVLALPSWNEGMPNTVLEATASGRRVVATSVGGIPDIVSSEVLGELVPPRDATALSAALGRALELDPDPERIVAAGALASWDESARLLHRSLLEATRQGLRKAA